jgi:heme-degrading monooxygenase HmoA
MAFMRINYFQQKPGTTEKMKQEAEDFLAGNDPETSGLLYILDSFCDTGERPSIGITIWSDKEKFEASGARWEKVMEGMAHLLDGPYRREEFELTIHNLPERSRND